MNQSLDRALSLIALLAALPPALVFAQTVTRPIPDDAKRGVLSHVAETTLSLDGRTVKLAPGGTIRDATNLVIMPTTVPRDSLVKYKSNAQGEITQAWILTREEAAKPDPVPAKGASATPAATTLGNTPAGSTGAGYAEPPGTPIERVLGTEAPPSGYGPPPAKRQ
jgi:hypothetical protein